MPQFAPVLTAVAAVGSYSNSRKAAKLSQEQQAVATRASRRSAIRKSVISRARAISSSQAATGSLAGSGIQGGLSSQASRLGADLGTSTQLSALSSGIATASAQAGLFKTLGGLAESFWGGTTTENVEFDLTE